MVKVLALPQSSAKAATTGLTRDARKSKEG